MALTIGNLVSTNLPKEDSMQAQVYAFSLYGGKNSQGRKCVEI